MRLLALLFLNSLFTICKGQNDSANAPYLKSPGIPVFSIVKASDSTAFSNKDLKQNQATIFIIFSPDCEYCQHETRDLLRNIDKFKYSQIIMITYMPYEMMVKFYQDYKIADYPMIAMCKDNKFIFTKFFRLTIIPSTFVYDKACKFKKAFRQRVDMDPLLNEL